MLSKFVLPTFSRLVSSNRTTTRRVPFTSVSLSLSTKCFISFLPSSIKRGFVHVERNSHFQDCVSLFLCRFVLNVPFVLVSNLNNLLLLPTMKQNFFNSHLVSFSSISLQLANPSFFWCPIHLFLFEIVTPFASAFFVRSSRS